MDKTQIHNLVELIVAEVIRRVEAQARLEQHPEDVAVLLAGKPTCPEKLQAWLAGRYGEGYSTIVFHQNAPPWKHAICADSLNRTQIMDMLGTAKTVILAAPELELLRRIAAGDDTDPVSAYIVRAILWKKEVRLLLDFEPPQFMRNTFFAGVAESIGTLKSLHVAVDYYDTGQQAAPVRRDFITEQDVLLAAQSPEKLILCAMGAIVTPSAKDAIAQTGVILSY